MALATTPSTPTDPPADVVRAGTRTILQASTNTAVPGHAVTYKVTIVGLAGCMPTGIVTITGLPGRPRNLRSWRIDKRHNLSLRTQPSDGRKAAAPAPPTTDLQRAEPVV